MPTNLAIDDKLLAAAVKAGKHRTKKDAVNTALAEYVKLKQRMQLLDLFGKIDFHEDFLREQDEKRARTKRKRRSA